MLARAYRDSNEPLSPLLTYSIVTPSLILLDRRSAHILASAGGGFRRRRVELKGIAVSEYIVA